MVEGEDAVAVGYKVVDESHALDAELLFERVPVDRPVPIGERGTVGLERESQNK